MDTVERVSNANKSIERVEQRHQKKHVKRKTKQAIMLIKSCLCVAQYESPVGRFDPNKTNPLAKQTGIMWGLLKTQSTCSTKTQNTWSANKSSECRAKFRSQCNSQRLCAMLTIEYKYTVVRYKFQQKTWETKTGRHRVGPRHPPLKLSKSA